MLLLLYEAIKSLLSHACLCCVCVTSTSSLFGESSSGSFLYFQGGRFKQTWGLVVRSWLWGVRAVVSCQGGAMRAMKLRCWCWLVDEYPGLRVVGHVEFVEVLGDLLVVALNSCFHGRAFAVPGGVSVSLAISAVVLVTVSDVAGFGLVHCPAGSTDVIGFWAVVCNVAGSDFLAFQASSGFFK